MTRAALTVLAVVAVMLSQGCRRHAVVRPSAVVRVSDEAGNAIPGATVLLVTGSDPHSDLESREVRKTDEAGEVHVSEMRKWDTVAPIMHGVAYYYLTVCVAKAGFHPAMKDLQSKKAKKHNRIDVALVRAESIQRCFNVDGHVAIGDPKTLPDDAQFVELEP